MRLITLHSIDNNPLTTMAINRSYVSEFAYHEKWYTLESCIKEFVEDIFPRLPSLTSSTGHGIAANHLAKASRLLDRVKADGLNLALKFPHCVTIQHKPNGYSDGDYPMMCELMQATLTQAAEEMRYSLNDPSILKSMIQLHSHILQHNAC
jgi:hypothetical protein